MGKFLILLIALVMGVVAAHAAEPLSQGFNIEVFAASAHEKWTGADSGCKSGPTECAQARADFEDLVARVRSAGDKLATVNVAVNNALNYEVDPGDVWQSPLTSLAQERGDCEDYAVLKRGVLLRVGMPDSRMRILAFHGHAVLAVLQNNGTWWFLDNHSQQIQQRVVGYTTPIYSINQRNLRLYVPQGRPGV